MSRPNAAYVGMGLTHPIRLTMNRGLHGNTAKLLSTTEALELITDLVSAVSLAVDQQKADQSRELPDADRSRESQPVPR